MLNSSRIIFLSKFFLFLKFNPISNDFYWFNEDTNSVENFYFNDWEGFDNHVDKKALIVGVIRHIWSNTHIKFKCFL